MVIGTANLGKEYLGKGGLGKSELQETGSDTLQVSNPILSPRSGIVTEADEIRISCALASAAIFYSVDDSVPSLPYTEPITLSEGTVNVKAKATLAEYDDSNIVQETYTVYAPVDAPDTISLAVTT